jgi:hypothetical protein
MSIDESSSPSDFVQQNQQLLNESENFTNWERKDSSDEQSSIVQPTVNIRQNLNEYTLSSATTGDASFDIDRDLSIISFKTCVLTPI